MTNYRGLPAVSYHEMGDFELQQETCAKAGITGRLISTPFAAEMMAAISKSPAFDVCQSGQRRHRRRSSRAPAGNWGLGTINPLDKNHIAEGERCMGPLSSRAC